MEHWHTILHTALLGTDKSSVAPDAMPPALAEPLEVVRPSDKEDRFLQMASVVMNYRRCGFLPVQAQPEFAVSLREEKLYCAPAALRAADAILQAENRALLQRWLQLCEKRGQLIVPEKLPVFFDVAAKDQTVLPLLSACAGQRGAWLQKLNPEWKPGSQQPGEDLWQTGNLSQRSGFLLQLRKAEPARARDLLQQAWPQENANTRSELLRQLHQSLSEEDVPWLEQLLTEKSQKVKDECLRLLKQLPGSDIVQQYRAILRSSVRFEKKKGLLGIGKKVSVVMKPVDLPDEKIFKTGIEKLSSRKGLSDPDHILHQLLASVPPSFHGEQEHLTPEEILEAFSKQDHYAEIIQALTEAALRFRDLTWLRLLISLPENSWHPEAFALLPAVEVEKYAVRMLEAKDSAALLKQSMDGSFGFSWSLPFTKLLFAQAAGDPYLFNRNFYSQHILSIPVEIIRELEKLTPENVYAREQWSKTGEFIVYLLTLKTETLQAFQP